MKKTVLSFIIPITKTSILYQFTELKASGRYFIWDRISYGQLLSVVNLSWYSVIGSIALADLGRGMPGARPLYGTKFFHFRIHFCQKAPMSEVHAPLTGPRPPTGNPGSATVLYFNLENKCLRTILHV